MIPIYKRRTSEDVISTILTRYNNNNNASAAKMSWKLDENLDDRIKFQQNWNTISHFFKSAIKKEMRNLEHVGTRGFELHKYYYRPTHPILATYLVSNI